MVKVLSLILVQAFLFYGAGFALADDATLSSEEKVALEKVSELSLDAIGISKDVGTIKTRYKGNSGKSIIHIQDAHCNYEAQTNISKILENLSKNHNINFVSVEGADGHIDTSWFKAFPDAEIRKEVADYFMKKGEITGAEFLSITSDYPIKLYGAEDRGMYIKNLNAFLSTYPNKEHIEEYLLGLKTILGKLKGFIYTKDLKSFDDMVENYKDKEITLMEYAKALNQGLEKHKLKLMDYTDFAKLAYTLKYEDKIDFKIVDQERTDVIDKLSKSLSKEKLKELVEKSVSFKTGKVTPSEYYEYLKTTAGENNLSFNSDYPNLANYVIYTRLYEKIDNEKLFRELDEIKTAIKDKIFDNDDQRKLSACWDNVNILLGLISIKLSNQEFDYYKAHRNEFKLEAFMDFITSKVKTYNLAYQVQEPSRIVKEDLPKLEQFYEVATERDNILVDNTIKAMNAEEVDTAVLITGGFHTEGISSLLEEKGVSYLVVCPNITKDVESPYIKVLTNQKTPFEELLVNNTAQVKGENLLAPFVLSKLATLTREQLDDLSMKIIVARKAFSDGANLQGNDAATDLPTLAARIINAKNEWIKIYLEGWVARTVAFAKERDIEINRDILLQVFLDAFEAEAKKVIPPAFTELYVRDMSGLVAAKLNTITLPDTPGTQAMGEVLSEEDAKEFDKIIRRSFDLGNATIQKRDDIGKGFQFVVHEGLLAEIENAGLPMNIHPGRGGYINGKSRGLLQAHIDSYVYESLEKDYPDMLRAIGYEELCHLHIFNLRKMSMAERKRQDTFVYEVWTAYRNAMMPLGKAQEDFVKSYLKNSYGFDMDAIRNKVQELILEKEAIDDAKLELFKRKVANMDALQIIVGNSDGPTEVIAITNGGDASIIKKALNAIRRLIFRDDNNVDVMTHPEDPKRGQLLGLVDATRALDAGIYTNRVGLGIMMTGEGTRLSPLTQRLHGIKPSMPMLIRTSEDGQWLSSAEASLYTWTLVTRHLKRMGFKGIAWKWADEPQIPSVDLGQLDMDLSNTDIVRFSSMTLVTDDLAQNKEWLKADEGGNLTHWVRRAPREEVLELLEIEDTPDAEALAHIGSPAFSHLFMEKAREVFADAPDDMWLHVDGYLTEALLLNSPRWKMYVRSSPGVQAVLRRCPDFYERCQELRKRLEIAKENKPIEIKVIDFGKDFYWGDIGQVAKARNSLFQVAETGLEGEFARKLAKIDHIKPDEFGNIIVGDCLYPKDGSVRNSVLINTKIYGTADIKAGVLVDSNLGNVTMERRSVVFGSTVLDLTMGEEAFSFCSVNEDLKIPSTQVHTSMPKDPKNVEEGLEDWRAETEEVFAGTKSPIDLDSPKYYASPRFDNPRSAKEQKRIMSQREVPIDVIEQAIQENFRDPLIENIKRLNYCIKNFKPVKMGTSGLRGNAEESLTDMEIYINVLAQVRYLIGLSGSKDIDDDVIAKFVREGAINAGDSIAIAGDFRPSTARLLKVLTYAIRKAGCRVDFNGLLPTPAIANYGINGAHIAVMMVTGSHNPFSDNGIKTYRTNGELLKIEEPALMEYVRRARMEEYARSWDDSVFDKKGMFKPKDEIQDETDRQNLEYAESVEEGVEYFTDKGTPEEDASRAATTYAEEDYTDRYVDAFGTKLKMDLPLNGKTIIIYQHSSVGANYLIPKILSELGATVILKGKTKEFVPVDTENLSDDMREVFRKLAKDYEDATGEKPFAVISADGDGDRPILCDENGEFLYGDKLGVIASLFLGVDFVATTVSANENAVKQLLISKYGKTFVETKIGSPHIVAASLDGKPNQIKGGFEVNGGYLLSSDVVCANGNTLKALPTRDALLPILCALVGASNKGFTISQLIEDVFKGYDSYSRAGLVENTADNVTPGCEKYTPAIGQAIVESLSPKDPNIREVIFDGNKVSYITTDGTEKEATSDLAKEMQYIRTRLMPNVKKIRLQKTATITKINYLDGVRIYLSGGEILHLRPSGNAAQFRVYAEADTKKRVREIIDRATAKDTGMLVTLINNFTEKLPENLEIPPTDTPGIYAVSPQDDEDAIDAQEINEKSTEPNRAALRNYLATGVLSGAFDEKTTVIIAYDIGLDPDASTNQVAQEAGREINSYLDENLAEVRSTGEKLLEDITLTKRLIEGKNRKCVVVTIASDETVKKIGTNLRHIGKVLNVHNKDQRYIPIIGLYELALRIAYGSDANAILECLNRIAFKDGTDVPFETVDVEQLLSNGIIRLLPKMRNVDLTERIAANKGALEALRSL